MVGYDYSRDDMMQIVDSKIESMIYEIRGKQVMLDSDLAKLYG
ncbi:MAG: ORF6N domain-containing protein [Oscillospiraceae bacterium]